MALELITAPIVQPITRQELKDHLRVDTTAEDSFIDLLIKTATDYFERRSWRQLMTATYKLHLDHFPNGVILLERPPIQSVTEIKYTDENGVVQTWSNTLYEVDTITEIARVRPKQDQSYPSTDEVFNAVSVEYIAGYGSDRDNVPDMIKQTVKLIAAHFYDNREMISKMGNVSQIPMPDQIELLINQYSLRSFL